MELTGSTRGAIPKLQPTMRRDLMKIRNRRLVLGAVIGLLVFTTVAVVPEKGAASSCCDQGEAILKRMADFLKQTKQYTVTVDSEYDVVRKSGEKIEFGAVRKLTVVRPDRIRVDMESRDGRKGMLCYNGQDIILFDAKDN